MNSLCSPRPGAGPLDTAGGLGHFPRAAKVYLWADAGVRAVVDSLVEAAVSHVRVCKHLAAVQHRGGGYLFPLKSLHQFHVVPTGSPAAQQTVQFVLMLETGRRVGKSLFKTPSRTSHCIRQSLPLVVVLDANGDPLVIAAAGVDAVGGMVGMTVAHDAAVATVDFVVQHGVSHRGYADLVHGQVKPLSLTRLLAVVERGQNGEYGGPTHVLVEEGLAHPTGSFVRVAGELAEGRR